MGSWFQDSAFNEGRVAGFQGPRALQLQDPLRPKEDSLTRVQSVEFRGLP